MQAPTPAKHKSSTTPKSPLTQTGPCLASRRQGAQGALVKPYPEPTHRGHINIEADRIREDYIPCCSIVKPVRHLRAQTVLGQPNDCVPNVQTAPRKGYQPKKNKYANISHEQEGMFNVPQEDVELDWSPASLLEQGYSILVS